MLGYYPSELTYDCPSRNDLPYERFHLPYGNFECQFNYFLDYVKNLLNSSWDHTRSTFSEFHIKPNQSRDCVRTNCLTFSFSEIAVAQKYCDISPVTGGGRKGWYSYRISDWEWLGLSGWLVCKIQDNGIAGKLRTIARKTKKQLSYSYQRKIHLRCSSLRSNERKIFSAFIARVYWLWLDSLADPTIWE